MPFSEIVRHQILKTELGFQYLTLNAVYDSKEAEAGSNPRKEAGVNTFEGRRYLPQRLSKVVLLLDIQGRLEVVPGMGRRLA